MRRRQRETLRSTWHTDLKYFNKLFSYYKNFIKKTTHMVMVNLIPEKWRIIINAICTLITTIVGALTITSCILR